jgi:hypothetical protein
MAMIKDCYRQSLQQFGLRNNHTFHRLYKAATLLSLNLAEASIGTCGMAYAYIYEMTA